MTTKLNENSVKNHISVDGVILTPEALDELKWCQTNGNEILRHRLDIIAEAVCFLGSIFYMFENDSEKEAAAQIIADLSSVRGGLKSLKKP